jgi:hypothetical protein
VLAGKLGRPELSGFGDGAAACAVTSAVVVGAAASLTISAELGTFPERGALVAILRSGKGAGAAAGTTTAGGALVAGAATVVDGAGTAVRSGRDCGVVVATCADALAGSAFNGVTRRPRQTHLDRAAQTPC